MLTKSYEVTRSSFPADEASRPDSSKPVFKHDAFISYSRQDEVFASKLEKTLEHYKPPRSLNVPERHLDIFRDKEDFTAGEYHENLVRNLKRSAKLIVICSPSARQSKYVNEEIREFVQVRGAEHIIPILYLGIPNNEASHEQEGMMAFPEALCEVMPMPLAVNYAGFVTNAHRIDRGSFSGAWYTMLANIYDVGRGDIEQREKKRRARALKNKLAVLSAIIIVLPALVIWAVASIAEGKRQQLQAQMQAQIAKAELTRNQNLLYVSDIILAQQRHSEGNVAQAQEILEAYLQSERAELRGFEWYYLMGQYHKERTTLETNGPGVHAIAFSPDGNTIASGRSDGVVHLWNMASNKEVATLKSDTGSIISIAFSPDGKNFATSGAQVKLWDVDSHNELGKLEGHSAIVEAVKFSPDGKTLATASNDKTVKLWDVSSLRELATFHGHKLDVYDVAFSPDGKMLATGSGDATVKLWDLASRQELDTLEQTFGVVRAVAFSPDGKSLAVGGSGNTPMAVRNPIQLWDIASRKETGFAVQTGEINDLAFSPDAGTLVSVSSDNTVRLWDITNPISSPYPLRELARLDGHKGKIAAVAFSPDGKTFATGSEDSSVKLWDFASLMQSSTLDNYFGILDIEFSPNYDTLAVAADNKVKLWDVAARKLLYFRFHLHGIQSRTVQGIAFSPDGKTLATAADDGSVALWDIASRKELVIFEAHAQSLTVVAFSPDGKALATASIDKTIKLWNVTLPYELATLRGHEDVISDVVFSPDGKTLASASHDRSLKLWDIRSLKEVATLKGHTRWVNSVRFSPDGKTLACGSSDNTIKIWDAASRQELATLNGHTTGVTDVAFSPNGRTLASLSSDSTIKLWSVATFKELITLPPSSEKPTKIDGLALAFSPNGKTLASGGSDGKVRLWQAPSDVEINFRLHGSK